MASRTALLVTFTVLLNCVVGLAQDSARVAEATGVSAGLAVHVGTTDGRLEAGLAANSTLLVHGLALDPATAIKARRAVHARGLLGRVMIGHATLFERLPYASNLVNLLVADLDSLGRSAPSRADIERVLAPGGTAYLRVDGRWTASVQPRPSDMDVWTHYNHGPDGNPVSRDRLAREPYGLRWLTSEVMGWGMFSIRATGRRVFLFWDTNTRWYAEPRNAVQVDAYDAFSGVLLWRAHYPYPEVRKARPVAVGGRLYMLSGRHVIAVDAADGKVVTTYRGSETPYDAIRVDDLLVCRNDEAVHAFEAASGKLLWTRPTREHPDVMERYGKRRSGHFQPGFRLQMLVAGGGRVYFADHRAGEGAGAARVVGLDVRTGRETWAASGEHVGETPHPCFWADGVLFLVNENGYAAVPTDGEGAGWTMPVLSWKPGRKQRFSAFFGADVRGYLSVGGLAWIKDVQRANLGGLYPSREEKPFKGWVGIYPRTGKIERQLRYPSKQYWSGRCYPDIAMPGCILAENMEIVDLAAGEFRNFRGSRGQCGSGFIVGNGLIYTNPMRCVSCYPMIRGASALSGRDDRGLPIPDARRLERGPAYGRVAQTARPAPDDAWPMYRHDPLRTNTTAMAAPGKLERLWTAELTDRATAPVIADGRVVVAVVNRGIVRAFDAATGKPAWSYLAGGRVDTPPTLYGPFCIFGCHDGSVYGLRAKDGALVWRFAAEPEHRRIVAYERVESPWPVMGSVLVHDGVVYALAGRLTRVDGGMHLYALDPVSGRRLWHQHLPGIYGDKATVLPHSWYIDEEHMLNNLLLAKGDRLRLYDQYGGWQFSTRDGRLEAQESDVVQPGWPRGRRTPKNDVMAERWPWVGWDRVTACEILAGRNVYNMNAAGVAPDRRGAGRMGKQWLFPGVGRWGIYLQGGVKQGHWVLHAARWGEAEPPEDKLPWKPRKLTLDPKAYVFTDGGKSLLLAGGLPFGAHPTSGEVRAVAMADGRDVATLALPAAPVFDGVAAALGRVYVSTVDGKLLCLGAR